MKKKFLGSLLTLTLLGGGVAIAQQPTPQCAGPQSCAQPECATPQSCIGPQACNGPQVCNNPQQPCRGFRQPGHRFSRQSCFEGLNLTDEQKAAIKAIKRPMVNYDSIQRAARLNYLKQLKQVLTPEQYMQFLENNFANQEGPRYQGKQLKRFDGKRFDRKEKKDRHDKKDKKDRKDRKDKK